MRRLVLVALVVAAGMVVLSVHVARGYSAMNVAVELAPQLFPIAAVVFVVLALWNSIRPGPRTFVVRDAAFTVPAGRTFGYAALAQLMLLAFLVRKVIDQWLHPRPETIGPVPAGSAVLVTAAAALVTAVVAVPWLGRVLVGRPMLELTPAGLLVRDPLGTRSYPWDSLRAGTPPRGSGTVKLMVDRPELVRRTALMRWLRPMHSIPMRDALVDSTFFADVVRFYVDHPERRAAIGTPQELARLHADVRQFALVDTE